METSNSLKHRKDINNNRANCQIDIRLNDECKNGHQDFAITATFWEVGKARIDRNFISGGCCHEQILKICPEFKIFIDLHLCDYMGIPMYASANGFYHMETGFDRLNGKTQKEYFCDYYRVTPKQYDVLKTAKSKEYFGFLLVDLGILNQWEKEAKNAIEKLEILTGKQFLIDSVKNQFGMSNEELADVKKKIDAGYYTPEAIKKREVEKLKAEKTKTIEGLTAERDKSIKKANDEFNVKMVVLNKVGTLKNFIYYPHSNEACFNWLNYEKKVSENDFRKFCSKITPAIFDRLPIGITFKMLDTNMEFSESKPL